MISVVITSLNEADKLRKCLESLKGFADEIVVVDLGSRDDTLNVCKQFAVKVYQHKFVHFVEKIRNFAISKAKGEWILILDPDELIFDKLKDKLKEITKLRSFSAVNIPRKNIFFGRWIAHTNWWPDRHIRFFQKGKVIWTDVIHSYPKVDGKILQLPRDTDLAIVHIGYDNLQQFIDRQNRYSEIEAQQRYELGERFSWTNFIWMPTREFLVRYIKHKGFLDGFYGFALTYLMCIYKLMVEIKLWEYSNKKT